MSAADEELTPAEELGDLLEVVAESMQLHVDVVVSEGEDELRGSLEGEDLGRFIGHHGETIEAVQHLAQRIVLRGGPGPRVVVDAGGYRQSREDALKAEAERAALEAEESGARVELEPMSAAERRFVHEFLRERGGVSTHSEGDEPKRRLVISPAP